MQLIIFIYLFSIQTLIKYHTDTPNVHFRRYFRWIFTNYKTLWWQIPNRNKVHVNLLNRINIQINDTRRNIFQLASTYQYVPAPCDVRSIPWSGL